MLHRFKDQNEIFFPSVTGESLREYFRHQGWQKCNFHEFFLAKVNVYLPIVDKEKSELRISSKTKYLSREVYRQLDQQFAIARDIEFCERLIVTDKFVDTSQAAGLRIDVIEHLASSP